MGTTRVNDQDYLRHVQYKTSANLNARAQLHVRFRTNPQEWQEWVFNQLHIPAAAHLLELGGGTGQLWVKNLHRIPVGWNITVSDLSSGMVEEQRRNLSGRAFRFEVLDAQALPYQAETFDAVIANNMLYHVPDRDRALQEIRRVIKPGGRFYAATNGPTHLCEIYDLVARFDPALRDDGAFNVANPFSLENGAEQITRHFSTMKILRIENELIVTEVESLVRYILSMATVPENIELRANDLAAFIKHEMASTGAIHITTDAGLFEAICE
jgi:ubiquinone/menaquinone biosynthesis C-methylase UbiE